MTTEQKIIEQRSGGKAKRAIAEDLGINERKVSRVLDQHERKLKSQRLKAAAGKGPSVACKATGKELSQKTGTVARCKTCRALVFIWPCPLCTIRKEKGMD